LEEKLNSMKYVWIFIIIIYLIVYGYSAHMTTIEPERNIWGYICTLVFAILTLIGIHLYSKKTDKDEKLN